MACEKKTYPSRTKAALVALHASKKRGLALRIYPCADCKGFHLTKLRTKTRR